MEWRQQSSVSCADAFDEARRWIEEVTGKSFGCSDFRAALENGVLLCDLINQLKPGIIKRVNRLSTPIAGLDNVNVFLKACGKLGLNESQLFHPGDLQDLSTRVTLRWDESQRRLKNVLITIYWLGRKAHLDTFYSGPQLNFKAFEGLLGLALSKALEEGSNAFVKDGYKESRSSEGEECQHIRRSSVRRNSVDGFESLETRTARPDEEGCGSDAEAEQVFRMDSTKPFTCQSKGYIPAPLRRKQGREENAGASASPLPSNGNCQLSSPSHLTRSETAINEALFLQAQFEEDSEDNHTDADPVLDDLYFRRVQQTLRQTSSNPNYDRFLPRHWTPEEESRVRKIYLGSQKRPWYRKMLSLRTYQVQVRPERPVQVNPGWIWSKSLSDIPMVYPIHKVSNGNAIYNKGQSNGLARNWLQENERKCSIAAEDGEAQWQDDLTKWKNRRRSTKSELYRRSQDREHVINQMINGVMTSYEMHEPQGGPIKRDQSPWRHSSAPRPYFTSPPSKPSSADLRPNTQAVLALSCATEGLLSSQTCTQGSSMGAVPLSGGNILVEETHFASLASDGAGVTTPSTEHSFTSQTQIKALGSQSCVLPSVEQTQPKKVQSNQISLHSTAQPSKVIQSQSSQNPTSAMSSSKTPISLDSKDETFCSDAVNRVRVDANEHLQDQIYKSQEERQKLYRDSVDNRSQQAAGNSKNLSRDVPWSRSASLPRGYRRSESSSRISSAITARPFGTKQSRVSSLPRAYSVDNNQGLVLNSEKEDPPSSPKFPVKRQTAAANLRAQYQASIRQKKANQSRQNGSEQKQEVSGVGSSSQTSLQTSSHQSSTQTQMLPQPPTNLQSYLMKSSSLPSNANTEYSKVDHSDMRVSLTLKPNSVPDFGFQTHWDSTGVRVKFIQPGGPAECCQLRVDDEIVSVDGVAVAHMTYNQWRDKMASSLETGSLTMDIRRYGIKDWSTSSENHTNQSGQSRTTLNLTAAAPVLIGYTAHQHQGAAPAETTSIQGSKFNWQADHVVQDTAVSGVPSENSCTARSGDSNTIAKKTQKRREEFFSKTGSAGISSWIYLCGGSESAISDLQVPSLSPSTLSWSWDREEDRRRQEKWQEEQERLLQEQYQRDQERLEAEWQRAQQDAVEGGTSQFLKENAFKVTSGPERFTSSLFYANGLTKKTRDDEQNAKREDLKDGEIKHQSVSQEVQNGRVTENDWAEGSRGFSPLSPSHRGMSLSTPSLSGPYKQTRASGYQKRLGRSLSKAERERQQILEEMKKRTQLLTDNSWIRQRSNSFHKEPIDVGACMKRYESLDNLDVLRQSPDLAATLTYPRPHSAAAGYVAPSRNAASRYSTGSIISQRDSDTESSHHARMVSGARTCCVCERVLGSGAAMVIEALSLCFHLSCFQCVGCHRYFRGTETGVQVRVRNRKPFCERCYFQLKCKYWSSEAFKKHKSHQPTHIQLVKETLVLSPCDYHDVLQIEE